MMTENDLYLCFCQDVCLSWRKAINKQHYGYDFLYIVIVKTKVLSSAK